MTEQETQQILKVLKTNYPNSFRNMSKTESYDYLGLWTEAFKNDDVNSVIKAVKEIMYSDTREFAPNIAQVKSKMTKFNASNLLESKQSLMRKYDKEFDDQYDYREDEMICLIFLKMKDAQGVLLKECKQDFKKAIGQDYDSYMLKIKKQIRKEVEQC